VIVAFLATAVNGSIVQVDADLRGLEVLTEDGERVRFELSAATGIFMATDHSRARLFFEASAGEPKARRAGRRSGRVQGIARSLPGC
jgi:hypothetical protein